MYKTRVEFDFDTDSAYDDTNNDVWMVTLKALIVSGTIFGLVMILVV